MYLNRPDMFIDKDLAQVQYVESYVVGSIYYALQSELNTKHLCYQAGLYGVCWQCFIRK